MKTLAIATLLLIPLAAFPQQTAPPRAARDAGAAPPTPTPAPRRPAPAPPPAPPPPVWAKQAVEKSPRHREWVNVKNGTRTVSAFVVYPEVKNKATSVVVIHEIFG